MSASVIGADVPRRDADDKLRGHTRYTVDGGRNGMLHAALKRADVAAGRIVRVDTTAARAMPGVRAIVTAEDAPGRYGICVLDHPLFATGEVRFHGEPIAAVAAETLAQARAAADAIVVDVEATTPALTMADALATDAPQIHPNWEEYAQMVPGGERAGNIAWEATVVRGDTDAAFARDDVTIVESQFRSGRQNQAPLEPRACLATYEDGRFVIETSTQVPWTVKTATAGLLGVSPADVRVIVPPVGGGFGLKFEPALEPFAALLARASGRSVRLINSRTDEMLTALARDNADIRVRSAVTADGEIVGREATVLMDCGAYGGEQPFLATMTAHTLGGNYRLGSVRLVTRAVYTNTAPTGAFRGCNGPYNTFALERHTDEVAAAIGMDALEFRRRNAIGDGDIGSTGQVFEGDVLVPMIDRMEQLRADAPALEASDDGRLRGRATVIGSWFVLVGPSAATVNINPDGGATLVTSGVEIGSGAAMQALPQIVADTLGLQTEQVVVRGADTDAAGYDMGVGGGRTTVSLGAASMAASEDAKGKLLAVAADMIEASVDDLELVDGNVSVIGAPDRSVSIAEVAAAAQGVTGPISGSGSFTARGTAAMAGCAAGHLIDAIDIPIFAVHECEVAVDPETGHVEVLAYRVVQDVGRAINPRAIRGQIQGGVTQGLGYALHEEITIGTDGQVQQRGLEHYRMPLSGDVVPVQVGLHEGAPSFGPLGAKGAGEVPILNVAAAVACAVADATGKRVQQIPLTPPRVLGLLTGVTAPLEHDHIGASWSSNVLADPEALLAAASV
jgi:CO/xanthine dehydrogenase Mo-binding subunit